MEDLDRIAGMKTKQEPQSVCIQSAQVHFSYRFDLNVGGQIEKTASSTESSMKGADS